MKVYVVVGHNKTTRNISARAAFSTRELAEDYDPWFDDENTIVELELDLNAGTNRPKDSMHYERES